MPENGSDGSPEYDAPDADFEIEVSSLRDPSAADAAPGDDPAPVGRARSAPFGSSMTPRRRMAAATTGIGAVMLALVVVLASFPGAGATLFTALGFATPTPTSTLAPGADTVLFTHSVPWGTLTIDSHPAALGPPSYNAFAQLTLGRGRHTLVYTATPFPTLRCQLSVPFAAGDTCPLDSNAIFTPTSIPGTLRTVDLRATPDHLPPDQYAALIQAIRSALIFPVGPVLPGDHYLSQTNKTLAAAAPLTAQLMVDLLPRGASIGGMNGEVCDPLCADPLATPARAGEWRLFALITAAWQFRESSGSVVDVGPYSNGGGVPLSLSAQWTGVWHAALESPTAAYDDMCFSGADQYSHIVDHASGFNLQTSVGQNQTDGCLLGITPQDITPTIGPPSAQPPINILYRFGALIAADDATERALPQLPPPSAHERAIIATFPPLGAGP